MIYIDTWYQYTNTPALVLQETFTFMPKNEHNSF